MIEDKFAELTVEELQMYIVKPKKKKQKNEKKLLVHIQGSSQIR